MTPIKMSPMKLSPMKSGVAAALALGAMLAIPAAYAQQSTAPTSDDAADPASASAPSAQQPAAAPQPATTAAKPGNPKSVTWAELDKNTDGTLSREETAPLASLSQVFAEADADGDGQLTPDEYKAYVASNGNLPAKGGG